MSTREQILSRISGSDVVTAKDFLDLASRDAVDKALQRLVEGGTLRRIDRGLYDLVRVNSITKTIAAPNPFRVIDAVGRRDNLKILVAGMSAANDLGLTNNVPSQIVVHVGSRLKKIKLGNSVIIFKQTAPSKLFWAGRPAMRLVQAMTWLRDVKTEDELVRDLVRLASAAQMDDLRDGQAHLPTYMHKIFRRSLEIKNL